MRTSLATKNVENLLLNPSQNIWQRDISFANVAGGTYTSDRWSLQKSGGVNHTVSRVADAPSWSKSTYCLSAEVTTADVTDSADYDAVQQIIEGSRFAKVYNKDFVLIFAVKSPLVGVHCVNFRDSLGTTSYVAEYVVNAPNTWEEKEIKVRHDDTLGTWNLSNGAGLMAEFVMSAGSDFHTTEGVWVSGNKKATINQVNLRETLTNDFKVTDLAIVEGLESPDFEDLRRLPETELSMCKRYLEKSYRTETSLGSNTLEGIESWIRINHSQNFFTQTIHYNVEKRAIPTITYYDAIGNINKVTRVDVTSAVSAAGVDNITPTTASFSGSSENSFRWRFSLSTTTGGLTFHWVSESEL